MTVRDRILAKPAQVQEMLRIYMVAVNVKEDRGEILEGVDALGEEALAWWDAQYQDMVRLYPEPISEIEFAELCIAGVRKQETRGQILRGNAN